MYTKENPLVIDSPLEVARMDQDVYQDLLSKDAVKLTFRQGGAPAGNEPPAGDPPPADPPPGDPPAGDPPAGATPELNDDLVNQYLQQKLGEGVSIASYLEQQNVMQELQDKAKRYESALTGVTNPWASDEIKKVNQVVKKMGLNDLSLASRLASETGLQEMTAEDILVLKKRREGTELPESKIREYIKSAYGYNEDDQTYERQSILEFEADEYRVKLKKEVADLGEDTPPDLEAIKEEQRQKADQHLSRWDPSLKLLALRPLESPLKYGEQDGETINITVPQDYLQQKMEVVKATVLSKGLNPDDAGVDQIKGLVTNLYLLENKDKVFANFAAELQKKLDAQYHAAGSVRRPEGGTGGTKVDPMEVVRRDREQRAGR